MQYGPAELFRRASEVPAGPASDDAVLVTCAYLVETSSPWVMQSLFHAAIGDARDKGAKALETFAYRYREGVSQYERFQVHKTIVPADFLADLGFAKWFVHSAKTTGWLRETELVPKTQGIVSAIKQTKFAIGLARKGKVPPPFPPHVAKDVKQSRALYNLVKDQGVDGALGIVQGEHALGRIEFTEQAGVKTSDPEVQAGAEPPHAEG